MPDTGDISWLRLIFACVTVTALMAALAYGLKYFSLRGFALPGTNSARRLQIVENLILDAKRRLVIVRCDGREHLLLLNAGRDIVIESNLSPAPPDAP